MVQNKNVRTATESYVDSKTGAAGGFPNSFADVYLGSGDGSTGRQTIGASFTTVNLDQKNFDPSNLFDVSSHEYNVPADGVYMISARIRIVDGQNTGQKNLGIGVHTSNTDHVSFTWIIQTVTGSESNRKTYSYQRMGKFNANEKLRLYTYCEGGDQSINNASLSIVRVA